ncbi:sensor histidine kinase [Nostocoides vanveenii]|uniref:histidine kinase n=1 Tax=Nostocoides vanveenii TaxID=330835 RepID=A0ABP4XHC5_9MICO
MAEQERVSDVWADPSVTWPRLDILTAALFALVCVPLHASVGLAAELAIVVLALALAVRRRSWRLMSALAVAAGAIQLVAGQTAYFADLAYAPLFFTIGRHADRRVRLAGLVVAALASVTGALNVVFNPDRAVQAGTGLTLAVSILATTALAAVICMGGWAAGFIRWQNQQAIQARIDAQLDAVERRRLAELYDLEQERRRIATDMHDVVAHSWAVVAAQADGARYSLAQNPQRVEQSLDIIAATARTAIGDLRALVARLRDPAATTAHAGEGTAYGLPSAGTLRQADLVAQMRASGMSLDMTELGEPASSALLTLTAHRLLAESLTNALKHGDLSETVVVQQDWRDGYRLRVINTVGERSDLGTGHGLLGMAERAAVAGGRATSRRDGDHWIVDVDIPRDPS